MTVTIYKDAAANAIFIEDANGVQFLNSLHAALESPSDTKINITDVAREIFVFHQVDFDQFADESGSTYGANATDVCNALNAIFLAAGSPSAAPVITSSTSVAITYGDTINYELTATGGVGYEWDNLPSGIVTVEGNVRKLIGGSNLASGTYTPTMRAVNYFGFDEQTLTISVSSPPFSNTKSVRFGNLDYLSAESDDVQDVFKRTGNGSGASDAWSVSFWIKPSSSGNNSQTVFYYGGNDLNNEGFVWVRYLGSSSFRSIQLNYGTNNNRLRLLTSQNSFSVNQWSHVLITYDGGTTGSSSGSVSDYYSRFKIFIDCAQQTTSNNHNNYGYSGDINSELFNVAKKGPSTGYMRVQSKLDEFAIWDSDQSANISGIYNSGAPHDLSLLAGAPSNWWRMGDGDTYPTLQDSVGSADFTMNNMTAADIVSDTP